MNSNARCRRIIPTAQLLEVKLEDGLGWEQICPFLGKDIPDVSYPRVNDTEAFGEIVISLVKPAATAAMARLVGLVAVPAVSMGAWYYLRYIK